MTRGHDRYEILKEIGRGGMATVFLARDRELDRQVALKILKREYAANRSALARMVRESRIVASLRHPNILQLHDTGEKDGRPFLVMEYLDGEALDSIIRNGIISCEQAVTWMEQVARALHFAHEGKIVHRDLKPANIMVERSGRVVVMDFGLAHLATSTINLTQSGSVLGTPMYMAPEQVLGKLRSIDARTDVYAMGAMLYELCTGSPPHMGDTAAQVYQRILHEDPVAPSRLRPGIPADLETMISKAMAWEPVQRYPNAGAFADDLQRHMEGKKITTKPVARRRPGKHWTLLVAAAAAVVAAVTGGLWIAANRTRSQAVETQVDMVKLMLETSETSLAAAIDLRKSGDLRGMNRHAAQVEAICRKVIDKTASKADAHFHWGRMLRAQLKYAEALRHQAEALAKNPDHKEARYEHGLLTWRAYEDRIQKLRDRWSRSKPADLERAGIPEPTRLELEDPPARALRETAAADFKRLDTAVALAFSSLIAGKEDEAITRFEAAFRVSPGIEEPIEWLGQLKLRTGKLDEAESWFTRGHELDRGYTPHLLGRIRVRFNRANNALYSRQDPREHFLKTVEDCDKVLSLSPETAEAWMQRAKSFMGMSYFQIQNKLDNSDSYANALSSITKAIDLDPTDSTARAWRGHLRTHRADDPTIPMAERVALCRESLDDFTRIIEREPDSPDGWEGRGHTLTRLGAQKERDGQSPEKEYGDALQDFAEWIRRDARKSHSWKNRANLSLRFATYLMVHGQDPTPHLDQGLKDFDEALRLDPDDAHYWNLRATLCYTWIVHLTRNPDLKLSESLVEKGVESGTRAIAIEKNPAYYRLRGQFHMAIKRYPEAVADFREALRLQPALEPSIRSNLEFCTDKLKK